MVMHGVMAMDEIAEYLWHAQLAQPSSVAAAAPPAPPADVADAAPSPTASPVPPPAQPYAPSLDQLLHALSDSKVREALVNLLQAR